jgi:hypothetical protein
MNFYYDVSLELQNLVDSFLLDLRNYIETFLFLNSNEH